jgi:putative DNA primase/helicase
LFSEGFPGCWAQNWTNGEGAQNWSLHSENKLTAAEQGELKQRREKERRERELEEAKRHEEAAGKASAVLKTSAEATADHPYLKRKGIKSPFGLRFCGDRLVMPLHDEEGQVHSLQYISGDGSKRFLAGGRKRGLFYAIGEIEPQGEVFIGEGFATMASVHEATGKPATVALDCGNLKPVAEALRKKYPQTAFIICADDDFRTEGNPGRKAAAEAAEAIGGKVAIPVFSGDRHDKATDFNDLHAAGRDHDREVVFGGRFMQNSAQRERCAIGKTMSPLTPSAIPGSFLAFQRHLQRRASSSPVRMGPASIIGEIAQAEKQQLCEFPAAFGAAAAAASAGSSITGAIRSMALKVALLLIAMRCSACRNLARLIQMPPRTLPIK